MTQDNPEYPPPPPPKSGGANIKILSLAVICVVLAASLVAVFAVYQPTSQQAKINSKNKEISSLQAQITSLNAQFNVNATGYENQISSLNTQLTTLTDELNNASAQLSQASNIMTMNASQTLVNSKAVTNATDLFDGALSYPGYVTVQATSNSTTAYIQTSYSVYGVSYNQTVTVGKSGTAAFPVLPTTVDIKIATSDNTAFNATVTVTFHY